MKNQITKKNYWSAGNARAYIPFIFLFLAFTSCQNGDKNPNIFFIDRFKEVISLEGDNIDQIRNDFYPLQVGLFRDMLVFCDFKNSPHFHVYEVPDFEYLGSFGIRGRGPGELLDPVFWGQFNNSESPQIWIYQMNNYKLSLMDIKKSLNEQQYLPERQVQFPYDTDVAANVIALNDSVFLGSGYSEQGEFFFFNSSSRDLRWQDFKNNYPREIAEFFKENVEFVSMLKQGVTKIKPDQSRFVKAMVYVPVIDVYHPDGKPDFSIILSDFRLPGFQDGEFDYETNIWYENIFLTDSYIYALNRNCTLQQYISGDCNSAEIHVYSWQGEPVKLYKLNEGAAAASPFVVDEKNRKIYSVNPKDSDNFFSIFDISGL